MASIPHLNELHERFDKRGLTIIGVTDEPSARIKPFISEKGIKYLIGIKGAEQYKTQGIPRAWLVNAKGNVVWEGHPGGLNESQIEEHLKDVLVPPAFKLPKELSKAQKQLNAGNLAAGIKELEGHLKKPKNAETEKAAKEAIEAANAYGAARLKQVDDITKERGYGDGSAILQHLEKAFKGTKVADEAKQKLASWKQDPAIKVELEGSALLEKAEAMIQAKNYAAAAGLLLKITKPEKYDGTKVEGIAAARLQFVEKKLQPASG